jgi:ferredoxin-NADP reductase
MEQHIVIIKSIDFITHDVLQVITEKPLNFTFTPGQAADISINKEGWQNEKRPFTFTGLPHNDFLQFTIKTYPSRNGVTAELLKLKKNDELILHDVFGTIAYRGEGVFIAGGAGVTPFVCIFRHLQSINETGHNKLIFANKTRGDIILENEFKKLLGENFINILSDEKVDGYDYGLITESFLKTYVSRSTKNLYICGPPPMMEAIEKQLSSLGVEKSAIIEEDM